MKYVQFKSLGLGALQPTTVQSLEFLKITNLSMGETGLHWDIFWKKLIIWQSG